MKLLTFSIGTLLLFFSQHVYSISSEKTSVKRYAFITASNNGGNDRQLLRYAESDALAMTKVFEEIGGLKPHNKTLLLNPSKRQFIKTLETLKATVSQLKDEESRMEFFFYYSGHSDEEGLLLRDGKLEYRELRDSLQAIDSDIRVAILDSCQSGVFTRLKGGTRKSPFLLSASNQVTGNVFLSASSADEAAQESDKIGSSFFTHHLISALRGASDVNKDRQVTLNEAYLYAFQETVSNTERSSAGAQHPAYNIQLVGAGDLVLTDLRTSSASLVIPENMIGRIYVRDATGTLVSELNKRASRDITLSLEPGTYNITIDEEKQLYIAEVKLLNSIPHKLNYQQLTPLERAVNTQRGNKQTAYSKNSYSFYDPMQKGITSVHAGHRQSVMEFIYFPYSFGEEPLYPDVTQKYTGYNISVRRSFSENYYLELGLYELGGLGVLKGRHITWMKNMFTKSYSAKDSIRFDIGFGINQERLSSFPGELSEYRAPTRMASENIYGFRVPIGITFENSTMLISAETSAKASLMNDHLYSNKTQFRHISINIGFRF